MLRILYGRDNNQVKIPIYFDNNYEDAWLENDIAKKIVKEIDKSDIIGPNLVISPVLGPIPPTKLSGGAKGLILMAFDDELNKNKTWYGEQFGDNTFKLMLEIAESKPYDITITTMRILGLPEDFKQDIMIMNDNTIVNNYDAFINHYFDKDMKIINNWDKDHPEFYS